MNATIRSFLNSVALTAVWWCRAVQQALCTHIYHGSPFTWDVNTSPRSHKEGSSSTVNNDWDTDDDDDLTDGVTYWPSSISS